MHHYQPVAPPQNICCFAIIASMMSSPRRNINLANYPSLLFPTILTQSYEWTYDFPNLCLHVVAHADSNQSPEVIRRCFEDHATIIISDFANEAVLTLFRISRRDLIRGTRIVVVLQLQFVLTDPDN
jgi:hypothetical protein